jgi:hypothetical protein
MIYIASPYSHEDVVVMEERAYAVTYYCYTEIKKGNTVFSPITYGHQIRKMGNMPNDWDFWMNFCLDFLKHSDELHVLTLDGWERSVGVKAEIQWSIDRNIPVKYITLD